MSNYKRPPNLFWPFVLIGVGVLLLLSNLNLIEPVNPYYLIQLWPLVLIALGIEILFGRRNAWIGNIISAAFVFAVLAFLVYAPQLNLTPPTRDYVTESFATEAGEATSTNLTLDIDEGRLTLAPLGRTANLVEIEAFHNHQVYFRESGNRTKTITFELQSNQIFDVTNFLDLDGTEIAVGVSGEVPLALEIDTGSASATLDLADLQLLELSADTGSGQIKAALPSGEYSVDLGSGSGSIEVDVARGAVLDLQADTGSGSIKVDVGRGAVLDIEADSGSGSITVVIAEGISGDLRLSSGSGSIILEIPAGTAIKVSGETSTGRVILPSGFVRIRGEESFGSGDSGTWVSPGFDEAEIQIFVKFDCGSGNFRLNEN